MSVSETSQANLASGVADLEQLRTTIAGLLPEYLRDLELLVNVDCGSYTKAGVDEVGRWTADFLRRELGAEVEVDPQRAPWGCGRGSPLRPPGWAARRC